MPTPTIIRGEDHFFTTIYEGNGGGQRVGKFVPFTNNGTIANSCIFNDGDSPKLARTPSSTGSRRTFTFSAWIKRGNFAQQAFFSFDNTSPGGGGGGDFRFDSSHRLQIVAGGGTTMNKISTRTFEDTSKFYHIVVRVDTTQSTAADRVRIYVDGDQITVFTTNTIPSQNADFNINTSSYESRFGSLNDNGSLTSYFDGYMAEVNFADGQSYGPDTFGITDTSTGRWIPKALTGITYGTNGFRLEFGDSSALGDDTSGNTNDFTATNLASTDQTTDSPTQLFATLQGTGGTLSEGNLKLVTGNSDFSHHNATLKPRSGKYYAEFTCDSMGRSEVGVVSTLNVPYSSNTTRLPATSDGSVAGYMYYGFDGRVYYNSSNSYDVTYATYTSTDIIGIALDLDNHTVQFFKNNSSQGTISLPNGNYTFAMGDGATGYSGGWTANFGQKSFTYTAPTGFVALQQDNLPETTKGIPDLVWVKNRDATDSHQWYDSSRGTQIKLSSDIANQESTIDDGLQKFLKGGFQIEDDVSVNTQNESYVAWNWVANGGTQTANADGSGASLASNIQANPTAGFSIVTYAGSSSGAKTVAHGLSEIPEMIIIKNRTDNSRSWFVYHVTASYASLVPYDGNAAYYLVLDTNAARGSGNVFNNTAPTNKIFHVQDAGSLNTNGSGKNYVAYCWHSVDGFSQIGHYVGNGSADGPFIYTGFKPSWIMTKIMSPTGSWVIVDNKRDPINDAYNEIQFAHSAVADNSGANKYYDFLSNGFKVRGTSAAINSSSRYYTYMAFAEHPFVGNGTSPVTAK